MTNKRAIVLLSGGLDSTTCLALARSQGYEVTALSFDYGQRHQTELSAAKSIARAFNVEHEIVTLSIGQFGGSALTDNRLDVPDYNGDGDIPITYVPARNTVFLSIALALAETKNANKIFIGVSHVDYSGYPDCRPEYIKAFNDLIRLATKQTINGESIEIASPLIHLSKAQTILLGTKLGVDYQKTISCYQANEHGHACGRCDSCVLRKKGFNDAELADSTIYA